MAKDALGLAIELGKQKRQLKAERGRAMDAIVDLLLENVALKAWGKVLVDEIADLRAELAQWKNVALEAVSEDVDLAGSGREGESGPGGVVRGERESGRSGVDGDGDWTRGSPLDYLLGRPQPTGVRGRAESTGDQEC